MQVFDEYQTWLGQYSKYTEMVPTRSFLTPLDEDEEIEVELARGNAVSIKYKAMSELQPNGMRCACTRCWGSVCHVAISGSQGREGAMRLNIVRVMRDRL